MAWDFERGGLGVSNVAPLAQPVPGARVTARRLDQSVADL